MPMALIYILLLTGINMTLKKKPTKLVFDYFFVANLASKIV